MATIVFIHGLNTYGDDDIHIGPLKFGYMHSRLEAEFKALGHDFVAVTGLGYGTPEEQAERALQQLPETAELHLLGQSTGGLVSRVLAAHPALNSRVRTVMTVGTPHGGTAAAEFALNFPEKHPTLTRLFSVAGYDTRLKAEIFKRFTPQAMREFNEKYPILSTYKAISLICEVERERLSWPLQFFYKKLHPGSQKSDGLIWTESQKWGAQEGPFQLDHFAQLGFFPHLSRSARTEAEKEFRRLITCIDRFVTQ